MIATSTTLIYIHGSSQIYWRKLPRFAINTASLNQSFESDSEVMEIESAKCECCGLKEDCTPDYISEVKAKFDGKWLCGLCAEAVRDEVSRGEQEAVMAHMSFCRKFKSNPAVRVADGMRQMLRRRSGDLSAPASPSSSSKKFMRSTSKSRVGDNSSVRFCN